MLDRATIGATVYAVKTFWIGGDIEMLHTIFGANNSQSLSPVGRRVDDRRRLNTYTKLLLNVSDMMSLTCVHAVIRPTQILKPAKASSTYGMRTTPGCS